MSVVFSAEDELGPVAVVEVDGVRSLHFGTPARQSALRLGEPDELVLHSVRRAAATLLFRPAPVHALVLGLGGGSLVKFLLRWFPACRVDAVERREVVVTVAHDHFALPREPRLRVVVGDAAEAVHALPPARYDLVVVDLYNGAGADAAAGQAPLFAACRARMAADAVLVFNVWRQELPTFAGPDSGFGRHFADPLVLHTENGNTLLFGFAGAPPGLTPGMLAAATELTERTGHDFWGLLAELMHFNPGHFAICNDPVASPGTWDACGGDECGAGA